MDQQAMIDPDDLPLGTSVVPVLRFNFLEAIEQFKKTLPAEYIRDSWFDVLKKQCRESTVRSGSLLHVQVAFLRELYRRVSFQRRRCRTEVGMGKDAPMISKYLNGHEDTNVHSYDFLETAEKEKSAEDLLAYIAAPRRTPTSITTTVRVATKTAVDTAIKQEAGNVEEDGDDESEISGETPVSTFGNKKRKVAGS
ncbi:hypothetical protein PG984_003683 [Apiospora sp. TS-2023a]